MFEPHQLEGVAGEGDDVHGVGWKGQQHGQLDREDNQQLTRK